MPHELPKAYEPGAIETRWADYWIKEKLFHVPTPPAGETRPVFTLLLPPPNVTGRLHMGHMLNQTQMDIIVRWHRMRGFITLWLPGTDHAGIATQMMVEKQLEKEGKKRRDLGREKFIERVWEWKREYGGAILDQMKRLGASVDWDREYFTMDDNLSRAVREVFLRLYEEGLIYRGNYIVNWCPWHETAISDLEVKHEEVAGKLWEIRYRVIGTNEFITVATTRPETMLGDTAIAVNANDERYTHLHGKKALLPLMNREIPIITDELAQPEFGTGAVKVTPAHDPNDFEAGKRHHLPEISVMDEHAHMNQNAGAYAGLDRFVARKRVLHDLKDQGFLAGEKDYTVALGKCDRCGTIVEPRLSEQWFVKVAPLAERAKEAVESGEITIVPENHRQVYLNWMNNIHDWCVSRQLWWGHRIPAWTCGNCKEVIVARKAPAKCPKCGGAKLEQVSDVLDTWFSSGLLPFTTLGWPEKTRDQAVFYPTTLLITAYEILFFWVARMIMFGCHFMQGHQQDAVIKKVSGWGNRKNDSVPFRQVYIHALVRDAERQKMSKTKGNVLDPLEIIERFGTDATRFTLAAMAAPGTDIAYSESRTDGYRAFANKIWNAARFMFMNVGRIEPGLRPTTGCVGAGDSPARGIPAFQPINLEDRWILSRFNRVAANVNDALATYRFHEAANSIYDFFWGEFCDWYLELIKPQLNFDEGADKKSAQVACRNLVNLFDASLRLLHPVMPFITEEIWQAMHEGRPPLKSIALTVYPQEDEQQFDLAAETEMSILQDLIVSVRNLRAEVKIEPKIKVPIEIFVHEPEIRELIEENRGAILRDRTANVEKITFVEHSLAKLPGARHTARFDVRMIYERKVDDRSEKMRMAAELRRYSAEAERLEAQLANETFLTKAPANVVAGAKRRLGELEAVIAKSKIALLDWLGTTDAKLQHYLPQFYLTGFLDPRQVAKGQSLLWVYESGKKPKLSPTSKAAAEVDFYTFEDEGEVRKTAEAVLSKLESHTAPLFRRLTSRQFDMTPLERSEFAGFVALTFCRTPFFLKSIEKLTTEFQAYTAKAMASTPGALEQIARIMELRGDEKSDVTTEQLREFLLSDRYTIKLQPSPWLTKVMFKMAMDLMPIIGRMRWNWLVSDDEYFVTADHPIALFDRSPDSFYSPGFMSSTQAEFTFPLSKDVCLYCRWIGDESRVTVNSRQVREINKRTMSWAMRYVFAPEKSTKLSEIVNEIAKKKGLVSS